ncbi:unnamed protein product [Brassica oleracea]
MVLPQTKMAPLQPKVKKLATPFHLFFVLELCSD